MLQKASQVKSSNSLSVAIDIWDVKHTSTNNQNYMVRVSRGTNIASSILTVNFTKPGRYILNIPVSPPEAMNLIIGMMNEHGQYYEDVIYVSLSTRFYVWIKYFVLAPVLVFAAPLLLIRKKR
jgi:hypothetical protein